jgi:hypothetical protein
MKSPKRPHPSGRNSVLPPTLPDLDKEWKGIVKFGRIDARKSPELLDLMPFKIRHYPSIVSYAPTGEYDLLSMSSAFNPKEIKHSLGELLGKAVSGVSWDNARRFLQLSPSFYESKPVSQFNVLLLPKKQEVPLEYLKSAMNNLGAMNFGLVQKENRAETLKNLEVPVSKNLLFSFVRYNNAGTQEHILESRDVSIREMKATLDLLTKHTIIGTFELISRPLQEQLRELLPRSRHRRQRQGTRSRRESRRLRLRSIRPRKGPR